jgi:succinate dehydrogenase / fumarate reductase membrane anchor subunit
MSLRTPLGRVRGLGSAKEGVGHWWAQRVTALALVPLTLWFAVSMISVVHTDYAGAVTWIGAPLNSALLILLLVCVFYHALLGLQVVIEDYVHGEGIKLATLLVTKFILTLLGAIAVVSVLRVTFLAVLPTGTGG